MKIVDIFAGVGGLSLGFEMASRDNHVVLANELVPEIAESYKKNHPHTQMANMDVKDFVGYLDSLKETANANDNLRLAEQLKNVDVVIGGPPCQGFSMAGGRIRKANAFMEDPRNELFNYYFNVIQRLEPEYFVFENVVGILSSKKGEVIETIKEIFQDEKNFLHGGYHLSINLVNANDYGVPQARKRVIILGSHHKIDFKELEKKTRESLSGQLKERFRPGLTVRDAIYDVMDRTDLPNNTPSVHKGVAVQRMHKIAAKQNWTVLDEDIHSVHSGAYGRLDWDSPATTITTRFDTPSAGRYIHPVYDRTITPREAARIQSFPDDFVFYGTKTCICKQIGNAVPPRLAEFLARMIMYDKEHHVK